METFWTSKTASGAVFSRPEMLREVCGLIGPRPPVTFNPPDLATSRFRVSDPCGALAGGALCYGCTGSQLNIASREGPSVRFVDL